jgi:hypothetical protein
MCDEIRSAVVKCKCASVFVKPRSEAPFSLPHISLIAVRACQFVRPGLYLSGVYCLCVSSDWMDLLVRVAAHAATPTNQPQRCILTDYFKDYTFSQLK